MENSSAENKELIEEMERVNAFEICEDEGVWYLYKSFCQLGGCSLDGQPFDSYFFALQEGYNLSLKGEKPGSYACAECRDDLADHEVQQVNEKKEIRKKRKALKGTGNIIIEVVSVKCIEFRMFYDSTWDIEVKTKEGVEKIRLLYNDTKDPEAINDLLLTCVTVGDIMSHDEKGLIYYD